jgi:hypothetical protein
MENLYQSLKHNGKHEYDNVETGSRTGKQDPEEMKMFLTNNEIDGLDKSVLYIKVYLTIIGFTYFYIHC